MSPPVTKTPNASQKAKGGPSYRTVVDVLAAIVVLGVLAAGVALIVGDDDLSGPETTTTVSKHAIDATPGTTNRTTVVTRTSQSAAKPDPVTRTKTTQVLGATGPKPAETTTTTEAGPRTVLERVLGDSGLVVLRVAAIVVAAFLAGAVVQRVMVGEYGGFKVGSLELTAVARASTEGLDELKQALIDLGRKAATQADLKKARQESHREDAATNRELALQLIRMSRIEERLHRVEDRKGT